MRAALVTRYGPPNVVTVGEAPKPAPGADEVLIRVHAASVNRTDCGELRGHPFLHAPLHAVLERIGLRSGRDIMVYGASGAIASAMVQLAKAAGARVTAVVATARLELVWSLGADRALDDTAGDFTLIGETFDAVGKTSFFRCRKLLRPGGIYAATDLGPGGQNLALVIWSAVVRNNRVVIPTPRLITGFAASLKRLMDAGQFRAVIDRRYPLAAIADASATSRPDKRSASW